ncbi:MAG: UDP-N-acetylglucosamine--N-acetylmuramyl-(pentapeptide) pyrophosphoryl-undecaprenol N-acetylglucosamine transferase [Kiritimatiellaeota bacterium]|nr:UDP-N-acetylglucosamine--N-acetylmuramyl-(pentapeptide) pyrophosphoryl-undecaprenol N-acetylglucosamine transferase [Kiritimatiellota bacterium]
MDESARGEPAAAPSLRVAIACGGTGGHIFPGLATADVLRRRGHAVTLWLAGKDVEQSAVGGWPGEVITVPAQGWPRGLSPRALRSAWSLWHAAGVCRRRMRAQPPDVLLAMGSYSSVGPVSAALRLGVPVVLHEANVVPGLTIRLFAGRARVVAASFEETRFHLRRNRIVVTGMPLRRDLEAASRHARRPAPHPVFTIMVFGGSRGAHRLNEIAVAAIGLLAARGVAVKVLHIAGRDDEAGVRTGYERAGVASEVFGFTTDVACLYAAADLALCRAGASTCAELLAFGVPALLVPYPFAAAGHQQANAQALSKTGAVDYIAEQDLAGDWLADYLDACRRAPERLARMSAAGRALRTHSGADELAAQVERVGRGWDGQTT